MLKFWKKKEEKEERPPDIPKPPPVDPSWLLRRDDLSGFDLTDRAKKKIERRLAENRKQARELLVRWGLKRESMPWDLDE